MNLIDVGEFRGRRLYNGLRLNDRLRLIELHYSSGKNGQPNVLPSTSCSKSAGHYLPVTHSLSGTLRL